MSKLSSSFGSALSRSRGLVEHAMQRLVHVIRGDTKNSATDPGVPADSGPLEAELLRQSLLKLDDNRRRWLNELMEWANDKKPRPMRNNVIIHGSRRDHRTLGRPRAGSREERQQHDRRLVQSGS